MYESSSESSRPDTQMKYRTVIIFDNFDSVEGYCQNFRQMRSSVSLLRSYKAINFWMRAAKGCSTMCFCFLFLAFRLLHFDLFTCSFIENRVSRLFRSSSTFISDDRETVRKKTERRETKSKNRKQRAHCRTALTSDQKRIRMNVSKESLDMSKRNPPILRHFITVDETWIYHHALETK